MHPQKFWFVENSGEIPENSGTEVSTRLFTIELSDFFLRKKNFFLSSASVRIAEHEKSSYQFQASVQRFEAERGGGNFFFSVEYISWVRPCLLSKIKS